MSRSSIAILLLVAVAHAPADVYRWVDEEGNVIFSDTPHDGAEKVELGETTVVPAQPLPRKTEVLTPEPKGVSAYTSIAVVAPANEATIRNTREVNVQVALEPGLDTENGHRLQLFYDGAAYGEPGSAQQFTITELERGAHELVAAVLDRDGNDVIRSEPSVFFVHLRSVQQAAPAGGAAPGG